MVTGWMKRKVLSTPGFPSPIQHPPKIVHEIRQVKGRGLGVFATKDIQAGDLILAERPLLVKMIWSSGQFELGMTQEQATRGVREHLLSIV